MEPADLMRLVQQLAALATVAFLVPLLHPAKALAAFVCGHGLTHGNGLLGDLFI